MGIPQLSKSALRRLGWVVVIAVFVRAAAQQWLPPFATLLDYFITPLVLALGIALWIGFPGKTR
jgi:hypothetical protein